MLTIYTKTSGVSAVKSSFLLLSKFLLGSHIGTFGVCFTAQADTKANPKRVNLLIMFIPTKFIEYDL